MRSLILRAAGPALLASIAVAGDVAPAVAQYYPAPGGYYAPPPPRPYYRPDPYGGYGGGGGYYRERPVAFGNVCVTSRGSCQSRPRPAAAPCTCFIPGFGPKRGGIAASGW